MKKWCVFHPHKTLINEKESYVCVMWLRLSSLYMTLNEFAWDILCVFKHRYIMKPIIVNILFLMVCGTTFVMGLQHIVPLVMISPLLIFEPWQGMQHITPLVLMGTWHYYIRIFRSKSWAFDMAHSTIHCHQGHVK